MKDLTKKQKQVLDCIISSIRERGYCPSVRELGRELGLSSPSTVNSHLDRLEELGYIRSEKRFIGRKPNTTFSVTEEGRDAFTNHIAALESFLKNNI